MGVVRLLLARADVDPENRDFRGYNPLYSTFIAKHTNTIRVLLDESNGRVNPESKDKDGLTQLAQASRDGNLGAAMFLLNLDEGLGRPNAVLARRSKRPP